MKTMNEQVTEENWKVHMHRVHREMTALVRQSVAFLSRTWDGQRGGAAGSGIYVRIFDRVYLVTCEHVVRETADAGYSLTHQPITGDYYHPLPHPWVQEEPPVDLALSFIDPRSWKVGDNTGVPVELIAERYAPVAHELLFVAGHPGAWAKFQTIPGEEGLKSDRALYMARDCPLPPGYDPTLHFAMQYERKKAIPTDGGSRTLPEPWGLSGSAIWDTGFAAMGYSENWNSGHARIVGIAQRWEPDYSCIIGTKAEALCSFLANGTKEDVVFRHWFGRGRPGAGPGPEDIEQAQSVPDTLKSSA